MSLEFSLYKLEPVCVFDTNITHNLNSMAEKAGIYKHLWRPEEIGIVKAEQLIDPLTMAILNMKLYPDKYKKHNPKNGWGSYEVFLKWLEQVLESCKQYPDSKIKVSR